jgi:aminoglycoside phosphotransferase (APT) family kinase protein
MDEALKAADRALRRRKALRLIEDAGTDSEWQFRHVECCEVIKHRPGRRLVIRYTVEARRSGERWRLITVYAKLFRGRKGERLARQLAALRALAPPELIVAAPLGYSTRWRLLVTEAIDGASLTDLLQLSDAPRHLADAMAGLAALHGIDAGDPHAPNDVEWRRHDGTAEAAVLADSAVRLAAAPFWSQLAPRYGELIARTQERLAAVAPARASRFIHRDLYPDQMLLVQGRLGLLDLDELALGEPELDLGNLIAHLSLADLQQHGVIDAAPLLARTALDAYARHAAPTRLSSRRLATYQAATLLRLASLARLGQAERSVLDWQHLAARLTDAAAAVLGDA